jgi:transposase
MPVAHVTKAMGISRQCAHRWVRRFDQEGMVGLEDRSSRPHHSARATAARRERQVIAARRKHRYGPTQLAELTGVPERTVTRILRRAGEPRLCECDGPPSRFRHAP